MDKFKTKVKEAVKNNFKISVDKYFEFEREYNFFYKLTVSLSNFIGIRKNEKVLDIGCGYGVSCKAIQDNFHCSVTGIDISYEMIEFGKKYYKDIELKVVDGESFLEHFSENTFDVVVYNAAIFIFPDTFASFKNAYQILKEGGKIGFSHYPEIRDKEGNDLFEYAFKSNDFPLPKKQVISDIETCISNLNKANFKNIDKKVYSIDLDVQFLKDFFSIPAQSASLFPKFNYEQRVEKVEQLFSALKPFEKKGIISWSLVKAEK